MKRRFSHERSVTVEQAIKILADDGIQVTAKEAEEILDFLYLIGSITVDHYIESEWNRDVK